MAELQEYSNNEMIAEMSRRVGRTLGWSVLRGLPLEEEPDDPLPSGGIYVASRTKHATMWRAMRAAGAPIMSSWIDVTPRSMFDDGNNARGTILTDAQYTRLWDRVFQEIAQCDVCVLFIGSGDMPLKGAFLEAGAALAQGKPLIVVSADMRGFSFVHHPLVHWLPQLDLAMQEAIACTASTAKQLRDAEPPAPLPLCPLCSMPLAEMAGKFSDMVCCLNGACDFEPTPRSALATVTTTHAAVVRTEEAARCPLPPEGWYCTRRPGHDGPCAARQRKAVELAQCTHPWFACCTGDCPHEHKDECTDAMSDEIARLEHVVECGGKNA